MTGSRWELEKKVPKIVPKYRVTSRRTWPPRIHLSSKTKSSPCACWSIEPTVRYHNVRCTLAFWTRTLMCTFYTIRTPKRDKTNKKSIAACRIGTSSTKLQLFVLPVFVITKEWKDICLLLVWHTYLILVNYFVVSKVAVLPTRLWNERRRICHLRLQLHRQMNRLHVAALRSFGARAGGVIAGQRRTVFCTHTLIIVLFLTRKVQNIDVLPCSQNRT